MGKGCSANARQVYFFCCSLRRKSLKDAVSSWRRYELGRRLIMKGFRGDFITGCGKNIVGEIGGDAIEERRLKGMFLKLEGEVTTLWDGLLG